MRVGDRVRCTDAARSNGLLAVGTIYTVRYAENEYIKLDECPRPNGGGYPSFFTHRFELVRDEPIGIEPEYHTHYVILYKDNDTQRIYRSSVDTERDANRTVENVVNANDYSLVSKKKIKIRIN